MKWLSRNIRLGAWIQVLFLVVVVLGWAPPPLDTVATWILITVFLPHLLIAQKFGGFSTGVGSLSDIIALTLLSFVLVFPVSLAYASLLHWIAKRIRRFRQARREAHASI
jgi:hypothetical protein